MEFVFVKKLVDEWVRLGHKCVVISPFSLTSYWRKRRSYVPTKYLSDSSVNVYNPRFLSVPKVSLLGFDYSTYKGTKCVEKQFTKLSFKPDFIYCHFFSMGVIGWFIAKKYNIPFFVASGESVIPPLLFPSKDFSIDSFRKLMAGCICVSSKNMEEATSMQLVDKEKCGIFPNGTDLSVFYKKEKETCRKQLGISQELFVVICVGFFCERKGQNRVLEAIRKLNNNNIKVIFLGNSSIKDGLILEGDEIFFKGNVDNNELPAYLCASDVFCLPSRAEGCCNAVIEAMACGLPIVSSDKPFNHDILDNKNSILIEPDNIDDIANAIQVLYSNKEMRELFSKENYLRAKELSISERASTVLDFINKQIHPVV